MKSNWTSSILPKRSKVAEYYTSMQKMQCSGPTTLFLFFVIKTLNRFFNNVQKLLSRGWEFSSEVQHLSIKHMAQSSAPKTKYYLKFHSITRKVANFHKMAT